MVDGISWDQLLEEAGAEAETAFTPIPDGDYDLEVVDVTHSMTKTVPSKNMWNVQSKVVGTQWNNRRVFDRLVLTTDNQKALGFFFRKMTSMGLDKNFFSAKPSPDQITAALKGRRFRAKIGHEEYQGETKNIIGRYLAPVALGAPPAPGAVAPTVPPAAAPQYAAPAPVAAPPAPAPVAAPPVAAPAAAPPPVAAPPAPVPAPAPVAAPEAVDPWASVAAAPAAPVAEAPAPAPVAAPAAPAPAPAPAPVAAAAPAPPPPLEQLPF